MAGDRILIEAGPGETRVARTRDGCLIDLRIDRSGRRTMVGNIYLGRVEAVLSGIAAAFVDVGLQRAGFLGLAEARPPGAEPSDGQGIGDFVSEGDAVLVQVLRDPVADKGAKLTTHITLTGRRLILMPGCPELRLSRRIEGADERNRLKKIVADLAMENEGFILRTAAVGNSAEDIRAEAGRLRDLWAGIDQRAADARPAACLHAEPGVAQRVLRDEAGAETSQVIVEGRRMLADLRAFCAEQAPDVGARLIEHQGPGSLFEDEGVEEQIEAALTPRVILPGGGRVIIEETAALTAIDVDSGGHRSGGGAEDTALQTNLEAADEIARQLRLRNLAGIIAVDFIPMKRRRNRQAVLDRLRSALADDGTPANLFGFTPLGLAEMTRQRRGDSLYQMLCDPCTTCAGRGNSLSHYSLACAGLRRVLRVARAAPGVEIEFIAAPAVIEALTTQAADALAETEQRLGRALRLTADDGFAADRVEAVTRTNGADR